MDINIEDAAALFRQFQQEAEMLEREARECPVPKPGGVLGRLLGFQKKPEDEDGARGGSMENPPRGKREGGKGGSRGSGELK